MRWQVVASPTLVDISVQFKYFFNFLGKGTKFMTKAGHSLKQKSPHCYPKRTSKCAII